MGHQFIDRLAMADKILQRIQFTQESTEVARETYRYPCSASKRHQMNHATFSSNGQNVARRLGVIQPGAGVEQVLLKRQRIIWRTCEGNK